MDENKLKDLVNIKIKEAQEDMRNLINQQLFGLGEEKVKKITFYNRLCDVWYNFRLFICRIIMWDKYFGDYYDD